MEGYYLQREFLRIGDKDHAASRDLQDAILADNPMLMHKGTGSDLVEIVYFKYHSDAWS